jgi:hypothetical protein
MPANPPGAPVAPGIVTPTSGYPEYGVGGGTPGNSAGWNIKVANNAAEKMSLAGQGYLIWFTTRSAAQNFVSSESSTFGSGNPPNPLAGVADIGDFFHRLTEGSTWTRVGEVILGGILIYAGVRALSSGGSSVASKPITRPAKKITKAAVKVAVPEARLASRVASKRIAPKAAAKVASHRSQVRKYGAKTPYGPRETHIYHHSVPKKVAK